MAIDRRQAVLGLLGTGAYAALAHATPAQTAGPARPYRIDIHHHFAPPAWVSEVKGRPLLQPANTTWTPARSIEDMDRGGVAAAMVSITNPGLWFGDAPLTRRLARACNDYGATLVRGHPARFGLFAAMPLPDVDGTLREIEYSLDTLKADGIGLFTSYGDRWLGHPDFRPVMEELHRRAAVVHVHPTAANCCRNLDYAPGVGPGSLEYGTDTTRAITGVAFSGDAVRFPGIRFIWSHAGGTVPFLGARIDGASRGAKDRMPAGFMGTVKTFDYDLAGATNAGAVASLLQLVPPSQVLSIFSEAALRGIERDNAMRLLPRLTS
jgi:6-methylsalicylate decarboxylase